jgi:TRAP-type C4-dicarboxylate transport system permease small subunit
VAGPSPSTDEAPRPPAGAPLLAHADWRLARLEDGLNLVAAAAIFGVMAFGVAQIASRGISSWLHALVPAIPQIAIHGYIDYIEFIAVLYAVLGVAYCQRLGGHIRMELVVARFRGRARWVVEGFAVLLAIVVTALLIVGTWDNFLNAWTKGDSSMDIKLQLWPSKLVVPLMLAVLLARLLVQLWAYLRLIADPSRQPLAVPVPETPEQVARREIEEAIGKLGPDGAPPR